MTLIICARLTYSVLFQELDHLLNTINKKTVSFTIILFAMLLENLSRFSYWLKMVVKLLG